MTKLANQYKSQSVGELEKSLKEIKLEIAKLSIERKVKPQKNSNNIGGLKKKIAVVRTLIRQNQLGIQSKKQA